MNMKKAMAAVLDKFPDAGARTHAALFLERYGDQQSPFTAWNAYGEEVDVVCMVLAELGMAKDTDWKETLSSLDPKAVRFHWTDAGAAKLAALPNWSGAETRRRLILHLDNPLEGVPGEPEHDESEQTTADRPGLIAEILKQTAEIAKKVPDMLNHSNPPVAPLWAMEQAARADGVDWLPEFNLFAPPSNCINAAWVAARPLWAGETHLPVIADKIGFFPLPEQVGPESPMSSPINGYLAYTVDELANVSDPRGEIDGMWAQFQAFLRAPTVSNYDGIDVLQFATDGRKMAQLVTQLVEYSYPGFSCNLLPTTHVAVHNDLCSDRSECADNDGCLRERLDNSTIGSNSVCYVGGFVLSRGGHVEPGDGWDAAKPLVVSTGDAPVEEAAVAATALTTEELGAEWFMMVHQNRSFATIPPDGALPAFRKSVQDLRENPAALAGLCSPHNAAYALNSVDNTSTPHGALVNGVCAAIRKVALTQNKNLAFVNDSPFEPDNFVSAVWSGVETDLAPDDLAEAAEKSVFPKVGEVPFGRPWSEAGARRTTDLLMLLRERPDIQLGFAKRTDWSHRSRVVLVETNVDAKQFLALNPDNTFVAGLRKQFVTSFVVRSGDPLSSVTWSSSWPFTTRVPSSMHGFHSALQQAYADIDPRAPDRICSYLLDSYVSDSDPKIRVGFLVDAIGRLVIVIRTLSGPLVERMHLAWRFCERLPLVFAAALKRVGRLPGTVVIDKTMSGADRRSTYLCGMARQALRWEDNANPGTLSSAYGRTTFVYAFQGILCGWDYDEALPSQWYTTTPSRVCVPPRS